MKGRSVRNILRESLRMAIDAIRQNKLRSILTLLGISIGVFSVIGVMTAIRTLESSVNSGLNVFAANTFVIQKWPEIEFGDHGKRKYRNRKNITIDQYKKLKERAKLPLLVSAADGTSVRNVQYRNKEVKNSVELFGGDDGTIRFYNTFLAEGRNFVPDDIRYSRNVCVLGMDVVDRLFPFEDPLSKKIQINGLDYIVIGITERQGEAFGQSKDNFIAIPISSFLEKFSNRWSSLRIHVESTSQETYDKTRDEVIGLLRSIRKVPPELDNDFEIVSNTEMIEQFSSFTNGVKIFALAVSVIALVVAGIGIMNIMLVSVTERIKEIGIRKAIGATKQDILTQFLMEAVFLSEFGGIAGIILGVAGGNIVAVVFNIPAVIPIDWAFIGLFVCSAIGIGFGIYPAWRAAQLDPIESLRFE
ncbi:MAG: ABC transporter permease [Candidatus Marinimicrobia bacterium]|jgi:putative ABC transport system permease protein|nr:ABC transporter permease [Candidatus Neomarinimicrobiota bacterium]|tara:strand:+ start:1996 stop:3246 length:1251 start_codon:yes stop_codon:yes gene_type:complete